MFYCQASNFVWKYLVRAYRKRLKRLGCLKEWLCTIEVNGISTGVDSSRNASYEWENEEWVFTVFQNKFNISRTLMCTTAKENPVFHTYSSMYSKLFPEAICEQT